MVENKKKKVWNIGFYSTKPINHRATSQELDPSEIFVWSLCLQLGTFPLHEIGASQSRLKRVCEKIFTDDINTYQSSRHCQCNIDHQLRRQLHEVFGTPCLSSFAEVSANVNIQIIFESKKKGNSERTSLHPTPPTISTSLCPQWAIARSEDPKFM
jgi:hypothetical protein